MNKPGEGWGAIPKSISIFSERNELYQTIRSRGTFILFLGLNGKYLLLDNKINDSVKRCVNIMGRDQWTNQLLYSGNSDNHNSSEMILNDWGTFRKQNNGPQLVCDMR